ncbi:hypothetical protein SNB73_07970 [Escherichia coli]|nr:hypothetical protein [Escherichia coli]MDQ9325137.1 hypothetical protein [Escherichia coli]MDZ8756274.1 hypothetical protein [Escherichia coli]
MTDITELAQSLKAAAIDAKELAIIARYSIRPCGGGEILRPG